MHTFTAYIVCVPLSLTVSLLLSLTVPVSLSLTVAVSLSLAVAVSLSLTVAVPLSLAVAVYLSLSLCLYLSLSLCLYSNGKDRCLVHHFRSHHAVFVSARALNKVYVRAVDTGCPNYQHALSNNIALSGRRRLLAD